MGSNPIGSTNLRMRHFVQYHNADKMGEYDSSGLGIVTNKRKGATPILGDRIWLVMGKGRPRRYLLCSWFDVSEVVHKRIGSFDIQVNGKYGRNLEPFLPVDSKPWFRDFKKKCGNFGFGPMPIDDEVVITDLETMVRNR